MCDIIRSIAIITVKIMIFCVFVDFMISFHAKFTKVKAEINDEFT